MEMFSGTNIVIVDRSRGLNLQGREMIIRIRPRAANKNGLHMRHPEFTFISFVELSADRWLKDRDQSN
jgi:hypothetical protein